jgi:hypothetical protein
MTFLSIFRIKQANHHLRKTLLCIAVARFVKVTITVNGAKT